MEEFDARNGVAETAMPQGNIFVNGIRMQTVAKNGRT